MLQGGYAWRGDRTLQNSPDPMVYYEGSELQIEWTAQHGCGPNTRTSCHIILQYGDETTMPNIRDGYPSGPLEDVPGEWNSYSFSSSPSPSSLVW